MSACPGVRFAFLRLQSAQHVTMFVHVVLPPLDRGTTWSYVRSPIAFFVPQY